MVSEVYNMDCMEYMKSIPDKFFELAVVDPPYGIGESWRKDRSSRHYNHKSTYKNKEIPNEAYFYEIFRISKNQIVWGGNYYTNYLPPRNSWIMWDKGIVRVIRLTWNGFCTCCPRSGIHPHEKPVKLYAWILNNYAKPGDKILDTHLGSGSSRIAAYKLGFDFYATEIDREYFEAQEERFRRECLGEVVTIQGTIVQQNLNYRTTESILEIWGNKKKRMIFSKWQKTMPKPKKNWGYSVGYS